MCFHVHFISKDIKHAGIFFCFPQNCFKAIKATRENKVGKSKKKPGGTDGKDSTDGEEVLPSMKDNNVYVSTM